MRRFLIAVLLISMIVCPSVVRAEGRSAEDYMAEGIRAAYDNMHLVYQAFYDENGELEEQPGGFVAIWQEWDDNGNLISRTYLGSDGNPVSSIDGYARVDWNKDDHGALYVEFFDAHDDIVPVEGINLVTDVKVDSDGWSEWMTPEPDHENCCFNIGYAVLGKKNLGNLYRCHAEIEFKDVLATEGKGFRFMTQGPVDGSWEHWFPGNIWNPDFICLNEAPDNNIYKFSLSVPITEEELESGELGLGFRCDNWASGSFRIRNIEIVKE